VKNLFGEGLKARLTRRHGNEATKTELLADFHSGKYNLAHYAGHAFFDPAEPSRSGILCAGREVLSGTELSGVGSLPNLVVFICGSGYQLRLLKA
jgi:CHAT domain-containing protein